MEFLGSFICVDCCGQGAHASHGRLILFYDFTLSLLSGIMFAKGRAKRPQSSLQAPCLHECVTDLTCGHLASEATLENRRFYRAARGGAGTELPVKRVQT